MAIPFYSMFWVWMVTGVVHVITIWCKKPVHSIVRYCAFCQVIAVVSSSAPGWCESLLRLLSSGVCFKQWGQSEKFMESWKSLASTWIHDAFVLFSWRCAMDSSSVLKLSSCAGWPREASVAQKGDRRFQFLWQSSRSKQASCQAVCHHQLNWFLFWSGNAWKSYQLPWEKDFAVVNKQQTRPIICWLSKFLMMKCWWTHVDPLSRYHQEDFAVYHWGTACLHCKRACKQSLSWNSWQVASRSRLIYGQSCKTPRPAEHIRTGFVIEFSTIA